MRTANVVYVNRQRPQVGLADNGGEGGPVNGLRVANVVVGGHEGTSGHRSTVANSSSPATDGATKRLGDPGGGRAVQRVAAGFDGHRRVRLGMAQAQRLAQPLRCRRSARDRDRADGS